MTRIPATGRAPADIMADLAARKAGDRDWRRGRLAVYYYWLDEELERVQQQAYLAYWTENNLGQRAFPSLKSLEEEVVGMGLALLGGGAGAGGTFTSGGSESIFLAMMAARNRARPRAAEHRAAGHGASHLRSCRRGARSRGAPRAGRAGPARRCRGDGRAHG
jgi:glutamate/tyrosine decarboxylase-like PLP-dependent enzyme